MVKTIIVEGWTKTDGGFLSQTVDEKLNRELEKLKREGWNILSVMSSVQEEKKGLFSSNYYLRYTVTIQK